MRAAFLDTDSLAPGDLSLTELERALPGIALYPHTPKHQLEERLSGLEVVIINKAGVDRRLLESTGTLKLILVAATGTNNVDLDAARDLGIAVYNCQGYGPDSVAQHVFALVLTLATRLDDYRRAARDGRWSMSSQFCLLDFPIVELAAKTMGVVGHGVLGSRVAELARAFGMQVLLAERPGKEPRAGRLRLEELLPRVDVLSLHCPLTAETRDLIGERQLSLMRRSAFLIHTARGGIVNEAALLAALRAGTIAGAGVDVLTTEPPPKDHPLLTADLPNLIVTPHSAWGSQAARQRIVDQLAENVGAFVRGERRRRVV